MRSYGILLCLSLKNTLASLRTGVTSRKTGKVSIGDGLDLGNGGKL